MDIEDMYANIKSDEGTVDPEEAVIPDPPENEEENEDNEPGEGEGSEGTPPAEGGTPEAAASTDVITSFLERYNVEGGIINYKDGSTANFKDLGVDEQLEILESLAQSTAPSIEAQYDLVPDEIEVLNAMRTNNLTFDQIVDQTVNARLQEIEQSHALGTPVDYASVQPEDIYRRFLKENNPDSTIDEIEEDLVAAMESKVFSSTVEFLRSKYKADQDSTITDWNSQRELQRNQEIESDKAEIVAAVSQLTQIGGWPISDDMKNEVLEDIMETDSDGQSKFMREVLSDPEKLFTAAWYMKNGQGYFEYLDTYYKEEIRKAKLGTPAKAVPPTSPQGFNRNRQPEDQKKSTNAVIQKNIPEKFTSLEDFAGQ